MTTCFLVVVILAVSLLKDINYDINDMAMNTGAIIAHTCALGGQRVN